MSDSKGLFARRTRQVSLAVAFCLLCAALPAGSCPIQCLPEFPYRNGWLGGDSAYSIALTPKKILWLFGDSFVGNPDVTDRRHTRMVGNAIGISLCKPYGQWGIDYYWRGMNTDAPSAFFAAPASDKLWPKDGFVHRGTLYLFLDEVDNRPERPVFGFDIIGTLLAEIPNPYDPPSGWRIRYHRIMRGKRQFPGVAAVKQERFVYVFTVWDDESHRHHPLSLLRLDLAALEDGRIAMSYRSPDGQWLDDRAWHQAATIISPGSTELDAYYLQAHDQWLIAQTEAVFGDKIVMRTAKQLTGSWTAPEVVYRIPELQRANARFDKDTFCYGAKPHESTGLIDGQLVVTYACNSLDFTKLLDDLTLYRPRVITVPLGNEHE